MDILFNVSSIDFEWMLSQQGVLKTDMEEAPRKEVEDEMTRAMMQSKIAEGDSDEDDW